MLRFRKDVRRYPEVIIVTDTTPHDEDRRFTSRTRCGIQNPLISWMTGGMS